MAGQNLISEWPNQLMSNHKSKVLPHASLHCQVGRIQPFQFLLLMVGGLIGNEVCPIFIDVHKWFFILCQEVNISIGQYIN